MKRRVAKLEGELLDAAVAMADGDTVVRAELGIAVLVHLPCSCPPIPCAPLNFSCNWALAGPIIERERITIMHFEPGTTAGQQWEAYIGDVSPGRLDNDPEDGQGHTPLIAAMRAYVASKYGETVELP